MRRLGVVLLTAIATASVVLSAGCSKPKAADLCSLIQTGELPGQLEEGFPKPGDGEDKACRWETSDGTSLRTDLMAYGQASALGEVWNASPRTIADREVYVAARGFTEPGGPVIECSSVTQHDKDALRMTLAVDEPRGDLCAELTTLLEKALPRLTS
ncbi:hypothetical protein OG394_36155 [Kribbella sp. NBC_01245]|uniref:hypothetical protein n=1 Tax=Kribbella sp. NBC_01245 TaxID=2903578 RepID=UPI002E2C4673|nr:hypothetical protein [Kribbella sp. NBC_01245]